MSNKLLIKDIVQFSLSDKERSRISNIFTKVQDEEKTTRQLIIELAATHSGIVINQRLYLPDKMKKGVVSWTKDYSKPILLHHRDEEDAIGRVIEAEYIDISRLILDRYNGREFYDTENKNMFTFNDSLIKDFVDGQMSFDQQVDVINNLFNNSLFKDEEYKGLGYINLKAKITDTDAIQKLLDGRYLTGSVGASSDKGVCSICKTDWVKSGLCEHKLGKTYNKNKCFLITGDLFYNEYSFVNRPADKLSKLTKLSLLDYDGTIIEPDIENEIEDKVYEVKLDFSSYDFETKENKMADEILNDTANEVSDTAKETVQEKDIEQKETLDQLLERALTSDVMLSEEDQERFYNELIWPEIEDAFKDNEDILKDAKLSTESRKKLAKSTFCGPNKSFPIPDCCITGDTEIQLLDHTTVKIKDLVNKTDFWVYGFDTITKSIVPAQVSKVWLAVKNAQIYKITLDNGKTIRCTGNHLFLTKSGKYIRADELKSGQSLMPLYTRLTKNRDEISAYEQVYQPWYNFWEYTHHMSAREFLNKPLKVNEYIHHVDGNKFNNCPNNLKQVSAISNCVNNQLGFEFQNIAKAIKSGIDLTEISKIYNIDPQLVQHYGNKLGFKNVKSAKSSTFSRNTMALNHTVQSVELDGFEDAYDMEVPRTSNFALADGVFVHNSHVTAARRLIGRYKGTGDKDKIMACINRKAKAMGCKSSEKEKMQDSLNHGAILRQLLNVLEEDKYFSKENVLTEEERTNLKTILIRMASLVTEDVLKNALYDTQLFLEEKALLDEIIRLEEELGNLKDQSEITNKEYEDLLKDNECSQDELIKEKSIVRDLREKYLSVLYTLDQQEKTKEDLSKIEDNELELELNKMVEAVDMAKITDKIGNGMSRTPVGEIDDPSCIQDAKGPEKGFMNMENLKKIQEHYLYLRFKNSQLAESYLKEMQDNGFLPRDLNDFKEGGK